MISDLDNMLVLSSDRRPNLAKEASCRRRAIYLSRVGHFRHLLLHYPCIYIYFYSFYRCSRHTRTYCKNLRFKMSNIEAFMGL